MKTLDGVELAGFIMERQAHTVRSLRQSCGIIPKLVIVRTISGQSLFNLTLPLSRYGAEIGVSIEVLDIEQAELLITIGALNQDDSVRGIIIESLPPGSINTAETPYAVAADKDVGGQGSNSLFDTPFAVAVNWLLTGYNIDLRGKKLVIVATDGCAGQLLANMWRSSGLDVTVTEAVVAELTKEADILVISSPKSGYVTSEMIKSGVVIVDVNDSGAVALDVQGLKDVTIATGSTGIFPLEVCAVVDNLLRCASAKTT